MKRPVKTTKLKSIVHKPENSKKRLLEAGLGTLTLLALFWSLVISRSGIDSNNASIVVNGYYWWFFGVTALVMAAFSTLMGMLLLKIHRHPLPIFLLLLTLLSLTLMLTSGWQPIVKL